MGTPIDSVVGWDPHEYERFADERARPFYDLLARVPANAPAEVVDLGCGPGTLTRTLLDRWPSARVVGVDNSVEMLARATPLAQPGRLEFVRADLREWRPARPVDVLLSNATLQWVPGHEDLLAGFVDALAPGGWLAFQLPGNFAEPSHTLLAELRDGPRWRHWLGHLSATAPRVSEPVDYLERLATLGCRVEAWETTYLHVLAGPDAVLRWTMGTALRPVLSALAGEERAEFLHAYAGALRTAYPQRPYGTVLPYRRIFVVARRPPT